MSTKGLVSIINKGLLKCNNKRTDPFKNGQKYEQTPPKMMKRCQLIIWKEVQNHLSVGNLKLNEQLNTVYMPVRMVKIWKKKWLQLLVSVQSNSNSHSFAAGNAKCYSHFEK